MESSPNIKKKKIISNRQITPIRITKQTQTHTYSTQRLYSTLSERRHVHTLAVKIPSRRTRIFRISTSPHTHYSLALIKRPFLRPPRRPNAKLPREGLAPLLSSLSLSSLHRETRDERRGRAAQRASEASTGDDSSDFSRPRMRHRRLVLVFIKCLREGIERERKMEGRGPKGKGTRPLPRSIRVGGASERVCVMCLLPARAPA